MKTRTNKLGFTMIELLVVIAVIGILAVALLATLNHLEQIRKGRDTRSRSDVSQMISAIERYNASLGYFPWQTAEGEDINPSAADIPWLPINASAALGSACTLTTCTVEAALDQLTSTSEVKTSFVDRITDASYADVYIYYNDAGAAGSVYSCFAPESNTFQREAFDRCKANSWGTDFPITTVVYVAGGPCPDGELGYTGDFDAATADEMICLP